MADHTGKRDVIQQNQTNAINPSLTVPNQPCHYSPQVYIDPHYRHSTQLSQSLPPTTLPSSHPQYYIPDITTVALQQIQLQTMLQLQAQQSHTNPQSSQHHTIATTQPSLPILPIPQLQRALINPSILPTTAIPVPQPQLPVVPEAQMASAYRIGRYTPAERKIRLERYREKRAQRNYNRRVKYDCRKQIADKRRRVQGRFVKREQEIALEASENVSTLQRSDATDADEETKLQHPESSASASSTRHPDVNQPANEQSFCEQSDHILQTF